MQRYCSDFFLVLLKIFYIAEKICIVCEVASTDVTINDRSLSTSISSILSTMVVQVAAVKLETSTTLILLIRGY